MVNGIGLPGQQQTASIDAWPAAISSQQLTLPGLLAGSYTILTFTIPSDLTPAAYYGGPLELHLAVDGQNAYSPPVYVSVH